MCEWEPPLVFTGSVTAAEKDCGVMAIYRLKEEMGC